MKKFEVFDDLPKRLRMRTVYCAEGYDNSKELDRLLDDPNYQVYTEQELRGDEWLLKGLHPGNGNFAFVPIK